MEIKTSIKNNWASGRNWMIQWTAILLLITPAAFAEEHSSGVFTADFLRTLRVNIGNLTASKLLNAHALVSIQNSEDDGPFYCFSGPYADISQSIRTIAKKNNNIAEQIIREWTQIAKYSPTASYVFFVRGTKVEAYDLSQWRISVLEQNEAFCSRDLEKPVPYHAIGILWLNR